MDSVDAFLRAEEEANQLVEELRELQNQVESYKNAREAVDKAAEGVTALTSQLGHISGRLGGIAETLRSIGTPELLSQQQAATDAVTALRQDFAQVVKTEMGGEVVRIKSAMGSIRNLVFSMLGLLLINLMIVAWLAFSIRR